MTSEDEKYPRAELVQALIPSWAWEGWSFVYDPEMCNCGHKKKCHTGKNPPGCCVEWDIDGDYNCSCTGFEMNWDTRMMIELFRAIEARLDAEADLAGLQLQ